MYISIKINRCVAVCPFILFEFVRRCREPDEMAGKSFHEIFKNGIQMRCLDYYGRHPERDGPILIGILIGKFQFTAAKSKINANFVNFRTSNWHSGFHGHYIAV